MNCPQCKSEMENGEYDIGCGIAVNSMHCGKCGFNVTKGGELKAAISAMRREHSNLNKSCA